ncbi:HD domain-containing protein 2 [Vitis vinifera]|uniref:5'-deoxynucleotidase n=1 Tax=Vitis vinifera TaxID=29760 RepID=A0A438FYW6_VITVI|nr:HD domain-containing protein 2 [Vitis vinifera]
MAVHLNWSLPTKSSLDFLHRTFQEAPAPPRLLSVRSQKLSSGSGDPFLSNASGFGPRKSANLDRPEASIGSSGSSSSSVIDFLTLCHSLKTTKRKGWINNGIKGPESIADHMYRMALMALIAGDLHGVNRERLDLFEQFYTVDDIHESEIGTEIYHKEMHSHLISLQSTPLPNMKRCIKIAIVHDIAEAIVGDITPSDGIPKKEKSRLERAALKEMCEVLGGGIRADEIKELWEEYENNSSLEANLVKDFDKVELILQALEYEMEHGKVLDEFFHSTAGKFQTEIGKSWAAEITSRRNSWLGNRPN